MSPSGSGRACSAWENIKFQLESIIAWFIISFVGWTSRLVRINEETLKLEKKKRKNVIFAFWHGRQFILVYSHSFRNIYIMTSLSKDGELQTKILSKFGYKLIRGSSSRKAVEATLAITEKVNQGYDASFAVDGPRGPGFKVKPGILFIAQKTNRVIIPVSTSARRKKIFNNWDKYLFPFPFNRCVVVYGKPIEVKKEDSIKLKAKQLEEELNRITELADEMMKKSS